MIKDIPGWEGMYAVTEGGKVWSHARATTAGRGLKHLPGRWMKPHKFSRTNHLRVYLSRDGKKYPMMIHRLVALTYLDNPNNLPVVNHLDGNPTNNTVENLEWTTQSGNCSHAVALGLTKLPSQVGSRNSNAKLNDEKVVQMRRLYREGFSAPQISEMFGVAVRTAHDAVTGQTWKHLQAA